MASKSGSVFSETLQTITTTKLEELTKQRKSFEENCAALLASTKAEHDPLKRVCLLQDGVKSCLGIQTKAATSSEGRSGGAAYGGARNIRLDTDLKNLDRFLEQARFDPSVSIKVLGDWEATLLRYLEVQSTKFQYADLYGKLVTEWLSSEKTVPIDNDVEMSESFEEIPGAKKLAARTEWEKKVFEPAVVDVPSLELYLSQLFDMDSKAGVTAVRTLLREKVEAFEKRLRQTSQFTTHTLATTIRTLQKSDLLSDSKREALKDFLSNDVILAEIADILNIRMAALDKWTWGDHVIIEQRRMLNGNFNIQFDPDLLQAIFLHYIGTKWSVFFKTTFKAILDTDVWKKPHVEVSKLDRKRRAYFLGPQGTAKNNNLQNKRMRIYRNRYFAHQLLDYDAQDIELQDGEEEAEYASYAQAPLQAQMQGQSAYGAQRMQLQSMAGMVRQTARKSTGGHAPPWAANEGIELDFVDERDEEDMKDIDSEEEAESDNYQHKAKKPMETKQKLLHLVSTELILNTRLHQDFTCFRTAFDSWNPLLPHDTITTVLKFFGVSSKWMNFFVKFLQAPLKFADDQSAEPRLRRRGAPGSHALSDVLSEVVFFCLDFSVNKATGGSVIHRLYDDLWFWNKDYDKCEEAWAKVLEFKDAMTVNLDEKKTGSIRVANDESLTTGVRLPQGEIRWGFLVLDSKTGRFEIDEKMVDDHVEELRKQLDGKSKSVIDWIQAWNSYAATFFSSNFGQASNSFGREHVDKMLATHRRVQERIFQGGNVVQYLKSLIKNRFGVMDIPDGFLFFPVELGGLDLKSPFVDLLQIRESVTGDPFKLLDEFVEQEQDDYVSAKHKFDKGDVHQWNKQRGGSIWEPEDADVFFPFTEYIKYREEFSRVGKANLRATFSKLLERPKEEPILSTTEMRLAIEDLRNQNNLRGILGYWESMDSYWKWIAQMYGPEMTEKFGGLSVVDFGLLPIGMVSMFRQRRTKWQG